MLPFVNKSTLSCYGFKERQVCGVKLDNRIYLLIKGFYFLARTISLHTTSYLRLLSWVTERRNRKLQRQEDELKQKINKPDEPVKRIFQQIDNGPRPSDVVPHIEDVTLEVENLVLNKDIGVQTDEFSYVFEPSPKQNRPFDGSLFCNDNDKVRFYTGLHSFQVLKKSFHFIEAHVKRHSMHLNKFQEFIMMLMKLRLNVPHLDLAYRFDVSRPVVTKVVSAWLVIMDVRLSLSFDFMANT